MCPKRNLVAKKSNEQLVFFKNWVSLSYSIFNTGRKTINEQKHLAKLHPKSCSSISTVKTLPREFRVGRKSLEGEARTGRPVKTTFLDKCRLIEGYGERRYQDKN